MKVGILGSGDVAQTLGRGFAKHGYEVMIGSREPKSDKLTKWKKEIGAKASTGSGADAAKFGEVVILATMGVGTHAAVDAAGTKNFDGKLVIDVSNPLDFSKGMPPGLFVGTSDSLAEQTQRKIPKAKVVKCFNTISHLQMIDPKYKGDKPRMLIAGDDAKAKKELGQMLKGLGWGGAIDCGGLDGARWLEALVPLWVRAAQSENSFEIIFQPTKP
jgi:predicted dinucleotide-binding enzyme